MHSWRGTSQCGACIRDHLHTHTPLTPERKQGRCRPFQTTGRCPAAGVSQTRLSKAGIRQNVHRYTLVCIGFTITTLRK